jgi:hypothetical protein
MSDENAWTYDYENHGNGAFWEWWNILRNGEKIGTVTTSEDDAKMVCAMLNVAECLSAEDARLGAIGAGYVTDDPVTDLPTTHWLEAEKALNAYADKREVVP